MDPGFPTGASALEFGYKNISLGKMFDENCIKKKLGRGERAHP